MAYKQHFIEWFSGKQIPSYWTTSTNSNATFTMADEVDGGLKVSTGATATNSNFYLSFNNKRQYSHTGSVSIFVIKPQIHRSLTTNWFAEVGIGNGNLGGKGHRFYAHSNNANIQLSTTEGSATLVDTGVTEESVWYAVKIENKLSSCEMSLSGTLKATATTGLQTTSGMQPQTYANRGTSGSAGSNSLDISYRYMECYNT
jgi:hypothetical protein